jgi:hypothetical protein
MSNELQLRELSVEELVEYLRGEEDWGDVVYDWCAWCGLESMLEESFKKGEMSLRDVVDECRARL